MNVQWRSSNEGLDASQTWELCGFFLVGVFCSFLEPQELPGSPRAALFPSSSGCSSRKAIITFQMCQWNSWPRSCACAVLGQKQRLPAGILIPQGRLAFGFSRNSLLMPLECFKAFTTGLRSSGVLLALPSHLEVLFWCQGILFGAQHRSVTLGDVGCALLLLFLPAAPVQR